MNSLQFFFILVGIGCVVAFVGYKIECWLDDKKPTKEEILKNLYCIDLSDKYVLQNFDIIKSAAENGNADAQLHIGRMYEQGKVLPKNTQKAKYWYMQSANKGNAWAQLNLGWIYENDNELNKAIEFYKKALNAGEIGAAYNLGILYRLESQKEQKKNNYAKERALLVNALSYLKKGTAFTTPLYNSSYKDFLKYKHECAVRVIKVMGRIDTIDKTKVHEEEAKRYASIATQCYQAMKEKYGEDITNMKGWEF